MDDQNLPADPGCLGRLCRAALGVLAVSLIFFGYVQGMGLIALVHLGLAIAWVMKIVPSKNLVEAKTDLLMAVSAILLAISPFGSVVLLFEAIFVCRARDREIWPRVLLWIGFAVATLLIWEGHLLQPIGQWIMGWGASEESAWAIVMTLSATVQALIFGSIAISAAKLVPREKWWFAFVWALILANMGDVRSSFIGRDQSRLLGIAFDFVAIGLALLFWYRSRKREVLRELP